MKYKEFLEYLENNLKREIKSDNPSSWIVFMKERELFASMKA